MEVVRPYTVEVKKPFLLNGSYSKSVITWYVDSPSKIEEVSGPFTRVEFHEPDIGSRQKLIKQLLKFGWKPIIFTDPTDAHPEGQPKLTIKGEPVESLMEIEIPVGKDLAMWYTLQHRKSQIEGWINNLRGDGRLTAGANSCGTNTARMRHRNVVNVPKADPKVIFGYEMRDLFIAKDGYRLVGHDAASLEARVMAHYSIPYDNGEFAREILHGDIHNKNARIFFPEETFGRDKGDPIFDAYRSISKNGFYALIYGAQPKKLAATLGCSIGEAKRLFDEFWKQNPGLGLLRDRVIKICESQGWVPGIDGRRIYIRSSHSALNALFQSTGAIAMKVSMVFLDYWVKKNELDVLKVIDMHDEGQAEENLNEIKIFTSSTKNELIKKLDDKLIYSDIHYDGNHYSKYYSPYGELAVKSIRKAGQYLGFNVDLDGEYKVGRSWAETH